MITAKFFSLFIWSITENFYLHCVKLEQKCVQSCQLQVSCTYMTIHVFQVTTCIHGHKIFVLLERFLIKGVSLCCVLLSSYLRVYGLRFSKEDHIALVKLFFELVTIDNLESPLLHAWCHILSRLLK